MSVSESLRQAFAAAEEAAVQIRKHEAKALQAAQTGDKAGHRENLTAKCLLLVDLPERAGDLLESDSSKLAGEFLSGLRGFARRAGQALDVDSVFYMYALLYPEDYQEGNPNDFERFLKIFADKHLA